MHIFHFLIEAFVILSLSIAWLYIGSVVVSIMMKIHEITGKEDLMSPSDRGFLTLVWPVLIIFILFSCICKLLGAISYRIGIFSIFMIPSSLRTKKWQE